MKTIGHVVKPILKAQHKTQESLAQKLSISRQQLNEILKRAELTDDLINKIEAELNIEGDLSPFRQNNYAQTAYGMVVIQNQQTELYQKLIEQYEFRLKEKEETINLLKTRIQELLNAIP